MNAKEELAPLLEELRRTHDVLPFLTGQHLAGECEFRRLPDEMVDLIMTSPDFAVPERGSGVVWLQFEGPECGWLTLIVARPCAGGELWVVAPQESDGC